MSSPYRNLHCYGSPKSLLVGLAVLSILERTHPLARCRWWGGYLQVEIPSDDVVAAILGHPWTAPLTPSKHLLYAANARRDRRTHVGLARAWCAEMPHREEELRAVLGLGFCGYSVPTRQVAVHCLTAEGMSPAAAITYREGRGNYGLPTIDPNCISQGNETGHAVSAWEAALTWESRVWLAARDVTEFAQTPGWVNNTPCDTGLGLVAIPVWWEEWLTIRQAATLFRPRGRHTPKTWADWTFLRAGQMRPSLPNSWGVVTYSDPEVPVLAWRWYRLAKLLGGHTYELTGPLDRGRDIVLNQLRRQRLLAPRPEIDTSPKKRGRKKREGSRTKEDQRPLAEGEKKKRGRPRLVKTAAATDDAAE